MLCSADGGQPEHSDDYTADERRSHDTFIGTDRKPLNVSVVLLGIVLGEDERLDKELRDAFRASGALPPA